MKTKKKLIDIPEEILQDLQILAVKAKKDLKNYIQDLLVEHVRGGKNKYCT
jgi:macrodomain Ter protein organizer (MatP/YcbG family)